jgi:CRP/FNR family cyclic AMP-dependent transcriptional regulator
MPVATTAILVGREATWAAMAGGRSNGGTGGGACPSSAGGKNGGRAAFLAGVPLFASLAEQERLALAEACRVRTFPPGEALFHQGDAGHALYILRSGQVKIVRLAPGGTETILAIRGAGECVGALSLVDGEPRATAAVALEEVEALVLPREEFRALVERRTEVAFAVMAALAQTARRRSEQVQDALLLDVPHRLAKKLLELAEQHGVATPEGIQIRMPLTQGDLAQMVGAARPTVNKYLIRLQNEGILTAKRGKIVLHRPEALRQRLT